MVDQFNTSYELVLGQAAKGGAFTAEDNAKMRALADRFGRRPWLSFSTLRETFSDDDKRLLNELVRDGYRVIPLTRTRSLRPLRPVRSGTAQVRRSPEAPLGQHAPPESPLTARVSTRKPPGHQ
jgi:hypothetical protein